MSKEKISSQEIIDLVSSKSLVSKRVAEEFLKAMISSVEEALLSGDLVKIKNLGTFKLQWNEPRKSVNVQTGEEILLSGYHKVTFTPDAVLRDAVNEPFAHLSPVELESENPAPIPESADVDLDPLRIFTDQAAEIKDLISEIQALSPKAKSKSVPKLEIPPVELYDLEEIVVDKALEAPEVQVEVSVEPQKTILHEDVFESVNEKIIVEKPFELVVPNEIENKDVESEVSGLADNPVPEFESTPFLKDIEPRKRQKVWVWLLSVVLVFVFCSLGLYFFCPPVTRFADDCKASVTSTAESFSFTETLNSISSWFAPIPKPVPVVKTIVIPKDTVDNDTVVIEKKAAVDSLQLLFDNPRIYKRFIATETVEAGNRLTLMAKKYYGNKDFWVYIYEANKSKIPDPDRIAQGTLIRIPKLDSRLIDANNPRCIKKARELHDIYVNN